MSKIKIVNIFVAVRENDGETYTTEDYSNIVCEAIQDNTTAVVVDGTVNIFNINSKQMFNETNKD